MWAFIGELGRVAIGHNTKELQAGQQCITADKAFFRKGEMVHRTNKKTQHKSVILRVAIWNNKWGTVHRAKGSTAIGSDPQEDNMGQQKGSSPDKQKALQGLSPCHTRQSTVGTAGVSPWPTEQEGQAGQSLEHSGHTTERAPSRWF